MTLPAHLDPRRGDPRRTRTSAHPPTRSTGRKVAIWSARSVADGADREDYPTTTVHYPAGQQAQGAVVQALIPVAALTEDPSLPAGTVRVVLGADFTGVAAGPPPLHRRTSPPTTRPTASTERRRGLESGQDAVCCGPVADPP